MSIVSVKQYDRNLFEEKVGYDWANKKMICRVYESLFMVIANNERSKRNWTYVIEDMLGEKRPGYYNSIRTILKQLKVIQYEKVNGRVTNVLAKGENWDRMFESDEDWSWFITNTNSGGSAIIVK
jgi:hypothetical protein